MFDYNKVFSSLRLETRSTFRWWRANSSARCWWSLSAGECFETECRLENFQAFADNFQGGFVSELLILRFKAQARNWNFSAIQSSSYIVIDKLVDYQIDNKTISISSWRMSTVWNFRSDLLWFIFSTHKTWKDCVNKAVNEVFLK